MIDRVARFQLAVFSEQNERRCVETFHPVKDWTPTDWMTAVAGEVGEAANLIKKARRSNYEKLDDAEPGFRSQREEIARELADAVTYIDLLATALDIDLAYWLREKFNEVSDRVGSSVRM